MAPINSEFSLVRVATAAGGPYSTIQLLSSYTSTQSREGGSVTPVWGRTDPLRKSGRKVNSYDLEGLLDLSDTTGQNVLRTAYENDTVVFAQLLYNDVATSGQPEGVQAECKVTEFSISGEGEGDYVTCSFTLEGTGVFSTVLAA